MRLDEVLAALTALPPEQQAEVTRLAEASTREFPVWVPNPGPQTDAYFCPADETLYGGQAGGGKTDLGIGLAMQEHQRSILFRKEKVQVPDMQERAVEIAGHAQGLNRQTHLWILPGGRRIEFGGLQHAGDEQAHKGRARDLYFFDEASDFLETQVAFVIGWNRSAKPGQRCRVVFATNPPTTATGLWLIRWFAPWLDPAFPDPAGPGELRWVIRGKGDEWIWVDGPEPCVLEDDGTVRLATAAEIADHRHKGVRRPRSRTYIPAELDDNPDLAKTDYRAQLEGMPEELQARYLRGSWTAHARDHDLQVIPSAWVDQAMERWHQGRPDDAMMTALGVDVAQGGKDNTVLAPRYGWWCDHLIVLPGVETPDGRAIGAQVVLHIRDGAQINIDLGGGWGNEAHNYMKRDLEMAVLGVIPGGGTDAKTLAGTHTFKNVRAEMWWRGRELLDPSGEYRICLPPDPKLKEELTSARYFEPTRGVIQIEDKLEQKARLGRSPDRAESVLLSLYSGAHRLRSARAQKRTQALPTQAVTGHGGAKHRYAMGSHRRLGVRGSAPAPEPKEMG